MSINESAKPLPSIFVDNEVINKRVALFLQNKYPVLLDELQKRMPDKLETGSIWYSKAHVETWLNEMNEMGANGMHVYLGEYEAETLSADNINEGSRPSKPVGRLCLLMVLTRDGETPGTLKNIIYEKEPGFKERLISTTGEKTFAPRNINEEERPRQFNFGSYRPPHTIVDDAEFPNDSLT